MCPCENEESDCVEMIKCISCRQWWHKDCTKHQGDIKNFKRCPNCQDLADELKQGKKNGSLGFFGGSNFKNLNKQ
jgi:hypothetical protein